MNDKATDELLDYRLDEALQTVAAKLSEATEKSSVLEAENEVATPQLASEAARHKQMRLNSHIGRASKDDVEAARVKEEEAASNLERIEAQLQVTGEDVTRLTKSLADAKKAAIATAHSNQRKKLLEQTHLIMDGLSRLSASVRGVQEFNRSLAAIPAEGVICEVRELSYMYLPSYILDFLDTDKISYVWANIRQMRVRLDMKEQDVRKKAS